MAFPSFASGDVLTASDMNAVGWWLVKTQTVGTAVTTVTVSSCFSTNYDVYRIVYSGGNTSVAAGWYDFKFDATHTNNYYGVAEFLDYTGTRTTQVTNNLGRLLVGRTNNVAGSSSVVVEVMSPQQATRKAIYGNSNIGPGYIIHGGEYNVATTFTGFAMSVSVGNMTGGTIRVYGYRN